MKDNFLESGFQIKQPVQSQMSFRSQGKGSPLESPSFASIHQGQHYQRSSFQQHKKQQQASMELKSESNQQQQNQPPRDMKKKTFQQQKQFSNQTPSAKAIPVSGSISSMNALQSKISSIKNYEQNISFNMPTNSKPQVTCNFNYLGDFSGIQQIFISFGENQMNMSFVKKNQKNVVMQKKQKNGGICWFICFKSPEDPDVYQLQKSGSIGNQASLILISGDEKAFLIFKDQFLAKLWNAEKLQVESQEQQLNHFLNQMENEVTVGIVKSEVQYLLKSKTKKQYQNVQQMNKKIRELQCQIKEEIQKKPNIRATHPVTMRKIEEKLYQDVRIIELYSRKFYRNLTKEVLAKSHGIISKLTLKEIINHLQIEVVADHADFNQEMQLIGQQLQNSKSIPYYSAIEMLRKLQPNNTPTALLQLIAIFHHRVKQSWHKYHQNRVKLSNMDDFLLITIYCVLLSNSESLFGIIHFLMDYIQIEEKIDSYMKNFDIEKKILNTLISSEKYLLEEWKSKQN